VSRKGHIFTSQYFRGTFWNPEFFNLLFNFEGEGVSGKVGKSPVLALRLKEFFGRGHPHSQLRHFGTGKYN
jgi:hypothetical protein